MLQRKSHKSISITTHCNSLTRARTSRITSAAEYRRQCTRTNGFDTCMCGVVCELSRQFSPFSVSERYYIVQYRRKKIRFRAVAANCSAAILRLCCGQFICMQHVFQVSQSAFSHVTVQFRHATTELCNFDAKQSTLCCFDGFRTLYCCVNADVSFRNYYHSNLSRLFSKASITVILLRFG